MELFFLSWALGKHDDAKLYVLLDCLDQLERMLVLFCNTKELRTF